MNLENYWKNEKNYFFPLPPFLDSRPAPPASPVPSPPPSSNFWPRPSPAPAARLSPSSFLPRPAQVMHVAGNRRRTFLSRCQPGPLVSFPSLLRVVRPQIHSHVHTHTCTHLGVDLRVFRFRSYRWTIHTPPDARACV